MQGQKKCLCPCLNKAKTETPNEVQMSLFIRLTISISSWSNHDDEDDHDDHDDDDDDNDDDVSVLVLFLLRFPSLKDFEIY